MEEQSQNNNFRKRTVNSGFNVMLDYKNYLKQKRLYPSNKAIFAYKGVKIALSQKQIRVLKLVAQGFSNIRVAHELSMKETTIKLLVYRLKKYLESVLYEDVDRFYLVIIAQELESEKENVSSDKHGI